MKQFFLFIILFSSAFLSNAQKIDSIYFHLYTDSLKKGTHNYINIDGKTSDGKWMQVIEVQDPNIELENETHIKIFF